MTERPIVSAGGIHKTYTVRRHVLPVLQGADLAVARGETVAIVGLSGAGKSTLLHILGGLDRPDQGAVFVDGEDLYDVSRSRRAVIRATRIGFVFQSYHLMPDMDVLENVFLPGMANRYGERSMAKLKERAMELLAAVGLAERAHHTPLELSGGEQQRAALARAMMNDPDIILADEPTGNLDNETGGLVLDYLFSLSRDRGHTLIVVTHSEQIAAACDRALRLTDGKIVG